MKPPTTGGEADASPILCPSARCQDGAYLVGVVGVDGTIGYVSPLLQVDAQFVQRAERGRDPERRFRFAQPCAEGGCRNWDGARCQVIDRAMAAKAELPPLDETSLPACGIRRSCRWFRQSGAEACRTCPLVITDLPSAAMRAEITSRAALSTEAEDALGTLSRL